MFIKYTEINIETLSQFYEIEKKIIPDFRTIEVILIVSHVFIHHLRIYFNCQLKQSINFIVTSRCIVFLNNINI